MATTYPTGIDGNAQLPLVTDGVSPVRAGDVNRLRNAIIAVETELGIDPSGTFGTVRSRLDAFELLLGGSGTITASAIDVVDADGYYVGINVETVLAEIGASLTTFLTSVTASEVSVVDADGYFIGTEVEAVLAELGASFANLTASQVAIVDTDGYYTSSNIEGALSELGATTEILTTINVALDFISGHIETPQDKIYYFVINAPYAGTISSVTTRADSGTATATASINGTPLGGSANAVSAAEVTEAHASANAFAAGDDIEFTISANLSTADLRFTLRFLRSS